MRRSRIDTIHASLTVITCIRTWPTPSMTTDVTVRKPKCQIARSAPEGEVTYQEPWNWKAGSLGSLWPYKPTTMNHPGQFDMPHVKSQYNTIINPMRSTSIGRLLSHMAHVLVTKMTTSRLRDVLGNDTRCTHVLNIRY